MTEGLTPAQVEYFISIATGMGIPAPEVPGLWRQHMTYMDANGYGAYGGRPWIKFCESQLEFIKERKGLSEKDAKLASEQAQKAAAARKAKQAEDDEYAKTAVSLRTWVSDLRARYLDGELLEPHEQVLARGELPQGHEDAASWLMESLADVRTFDGKRPRRPDPCGHPGCGLPVHAWVGFGGRRYSSGRCSDHTPEQDWSIK